MSIPARKSDYFQVFRLEEAPLAGLGSLYEAPFTISNWFSTHEWIEFTAIKLVKNE